MYIYKEVGWLTIAHHFLSSSCTRGLKPGINQLMNFMANLKNCDKYVLIYVNQQSNMAIKKALVHRICMRIIGDV